MFKQTRIGNSQINIARGRARSHATWSTLIWGAVALTCFASPDEVRELKQFQEFVKKDCAELAYCEGIAVSTKYFTFSKPPVFTTKVTERFKISSVPIGKDGDATLCVSWCT